MSGRRSLTLLQPYLETKSFVDTVTETRQVVYLAEYLRWIYITTI